MRELFKGVLEGTVSEDGFDLLDDNGNDAMADFNENALEEAMEKIAGKRIRATIIIEEVE